MSDSLTVSLGQIAVRERWNPRTQMDERELERLAKNIARHGLLQPLLVSPNPEADGNGSPPYQLVAGHRRYEACLRAGIHNARVEVREPAQTDDDLVWSIIENVQREDLNPVDEAFAYLRLYEQEGMTYSGIAERVGVTKARVSQRIDLTALPDSVIDSIRTGRLSTNAVKPLKKIAAEASVEAAEELASLIASGTISIQAFVSDPTRYLARVDEPQYGIYGIARRDLKTELEHIDDPEFHAAVKECHAITGWSSIWASPTDADLDRLRAAKALIEHGERGDWDYAAYVTSREHYEHLIGELAKRELKAARNEAVQAAKESGTEDGKPLSPDEVAAKATAERKAERDAEKAAAEAAYAANQELGAKLYADFASLKLDRKVATALAELLLRRCDLENLVAAGIRYTHPGYSQLETRKLKTGEERSKVVYLENHSEECPSFAERAKEWIAGGRDEGEVLARAIQLLVAAALAQPEALARSNRPPNPLTQDELRPLLAALGTQLPKVARDRAKAT